MPQAFPFAPTEEQAEIISAAKSPSPLMIQAFAGTAKTTTIALAAPQIRVPALALAFNRRIAEELKPRLPENWTVKTLNGLGHLAWIRGLPPRIGLEMDERKVGRIVREVAKAGKADLSKDQWEQTHALVSAAMRAGLSPNDEGAPLVPDSEETWTDLAAETGIVWFDIPLLIDLARSTLVASIAEAKQGKICFDDQVYCPTILGGKWPRYPALAVDEAQDLSLLNHRMLQLSSRDDSKLLVVGDSKQAIYAWRGADADSMRTLRSAREGWEDRKLTLTFRCPRVIVTRQQRHAPGFRAASGNAEGHFVAWREAADLGGWSWKMLRSFRPGSVAVLCRNNAPLISLAFKLLRQRVAPVIAGRDIGKGLLALGRKVARAEDSASLVLGKIEAWEQSELVLAQGSERTDGISDRAQCLREVLLGASCSTGADLLDALTFLFSRTEGDVTLSTIHRAKGLEWDIVLHLDPWRVPSKRAREAERNGDPSALEQDWNLKYVCETRTRDILVLANLDEFR